MRRTCRQATNRRRCSLWNHNYQIRSRHILDSAVGLQFGAFLSCVSLIFALLGTMNRMRYSADAPVQKLLGCVTDTWGAGSLMFSLVGFGQTCFGDIEHMNDHESMTLYDIELGPGIMLYGVCAFAGAVRCPPPSRTPHAHGRTHHMPPTTP